MAELTKYNITGPYKRMGSFPIDDSSFYDNYNKALQYLQNPTSYIGQLISVVLDNKAKLYIIDLQEDTTEGTTTYVKYLKEIGNVEIDIPEGGTIDLSQYLKIIDAASTYETKTDATNKLTEAKQYAEQYTNSAIQNIPSGGGESSYQGSASIDITDNVISVKEVNSSIVSMQSIPVGGTPLADILTAKGINTINAGNLQSVIESLFSNETWPTPVRIIPASASASQGKPTITFSKSIAIVGETVTVSASAATASGSATVSYSNFDNGYSTSNDNTKDGDTPPSVIKYIKHTSGIYELSASVTAGFNSGTISADNITETNTSATLSASSLVVELGTNTVKVETSTPTFSITIPASEMPAYYACSTLKKTSTEHMVAAATEDKVYSGLTASNNDSYSVTGVYPIYTNATWAIDPIKDNAGDNQSNAIIAYSKTGTTEASCSAKLTSLTNDTVTFYAFIAFGNGGFTFKLPSGWKITKAQTKSDSKGGYFDGNQGIPTPTPETIRVAGTVNHSYKVYDFNIIASNVIRLEIKFDNK